MNLQSFIILLINFRIQQNVAIYLENFNHHNPNNIQQLNSNNRNLQNSYNSQLFSNSDNTWSNLYNYNNNNNWNTHLPLVRNILPPDIANFRSQIEQQQPLQQRQHSLQNFNLFSNKDNDNNQHNTITTYLNPVKLKSNDAPSYQLSSVIDDNNNYLFNSSNNYSINNGHNNRNNDTNSNRIKARINRLKNIFDLNKLNVLKAHLIRGNNNSADNGDALKSLEDAPSAREKEQLSISEDIPWIDQNVVDANDSSLSEHRGFVSSLLDFIPGNELSWDDDEFLTDLVGRDAEARKKKHKLKKKLKKMALPLLLAYKLKFFLLIPLLLGGLVLLVGATGTAGFFFALFAAVMSLKSESLHFKGDH